MNIKSLDAFVHRATSLGLALVVTLGMLGGIDSLAQRPQAELQPQELATAAAAPRA